MRSPKDWSTAWKTTFDVKKEIYGRNHRIAVGGATDDGEPADSGEEEQQPLDQDPVKTDRKGDSIEPVFYFGQKVDYYEDPRGSRHVMLGDPIRGLLCDPIIRYL